ncbi:MAG: type III-B CRISPR-associated protein Cas10/Cmr2 [Firmicutes bacterium]|nr:type III-B CRISPR-associated protein Cas10/Cmr2 [Bacillota bacterium]
MTGEDIISNEEPQQSLQFTFSPVQAFVAQAKKTRDLWAGSYLLSYLAGSAMLPIRRRVTFPCVESDPLMEMLIGIQACRSSEEGKSKSIQDVRKANEYQTGSPRIGDLRPYLIGSLPNRFQADGDCPEKLARMAEERLSATWKRIVDKVWGLLSRIANKGETLLGPVQEEVWRRQTENLWEVLWVAGNGAAMEERKQWRIVFPPAEPGERCTVCGEREALSPPCQSPPRWERDASPAPKCATRREVREYWAKLAYAVASAGLGPQFELDGSERLCAICTIKRLFPWISGEIPDLEERRYFPSTPHMAARDWLKRVAQMAAEDPAVIEAVKRFILEAEQAGVSTERSSQGTTEDSEFECEDLRTRVSTGDAGERLGQGYLNKLRRFNGHVYFPESIKAQKDLLRRPERRAPLLEALVELQKLTGFPEGPSPYYALLVMDGDWMGALLSRHASERREISMALSRFSHKVPEIVHRYDGETIYAGGDDVLAILPVGSALNCALDLRDLYLECFRQAVPEVTATTSAGIIFAHMNSSLQQVVADAHRLLDKEAKDAAGRNAFAVRIWRRGGPDLTFSRPWEDPAGDGERRPMSFIKDLEKFGDGISSGEYSSKFLYKLREIFQLIEGPSSDCREAEKPGAPGEIQLDDEDLEDIIVAEYLDNREIGKKEEEPHEVERKARERVRLLIRLSKPASWERGGSGSGEYKVSYKQRIEPGAFILARFLAQKEV